jgi:hypothetical protein
MTNNYKLGTNSQCTLSRRVCVMCVHFLGVSVDSSRCSQLSRCYLLISLSSFLTRAGSSSCLVLIQLFLPTCSPLLPKSKRGQKNRKDVSCLHLTPSNNHSSYKDSCYLFIYFRVYSVGDIYFVFFLSSPVLFRFDMSKKNGTDNSKWPIE